MRLKLILESGSTKEYYIELSLVGPPSKGSNRKLGEYLLPHNLSTINWDLINNEAYLDLCVIYDLTHDQKASGSIQALKNEFIKRKTSNAELIIKLIHDYHQEQHKSYWKGVEIQNGPTHNESYYMTELVDMALYIDGKKLKINNLYGEQIFDELKKQIIDNS